MMTNILMTCQLLFLYSLSCVGDIQNLPLNDAEKTTMQKVVSCLH